MANDPLLSIWGKLPRTEGNDSLYHPLLCHLIDVSVVAHALWREVLPASFRNAVARELSLHEDRAGRWVAFWAGLHDLGKACPSFQFRCPVAHERLIKSGLPRPSHTLVVSHGAVTTYAVRAILLSEFGHLDPLARQVATLIGGHHGEFFGSRAIHNLDSAAVGRGIWMEVRKQIALKLADVVRPPDDVPRSLSNAVAMTLAGLVSVADWIGSAEEFFPLAAGADASVDFASYAGDSAHRARQALTHLGWLRKPSIETRLSFRALFPHIQTPNPLQQEVIALAEELPGPGLVIAEAPTGEGKTEAALYLVDWWNMQLDQRGAYFALPTQATSNQMFGRVRDFLAAGHPSEELDLQLIHGHATLSAEFEVLRRHGDRLLEPGGSGVPEDGDEEARSNVVAAEWFTHRKRGLLSGFGVGTVDQALLAALKARHVFVRLFGLSGKTVVVDEVHAYDTYMTTLLERLLEWLAALGTSVVMLSATLPAARRQGLLEAYRQGAGWSAADAPSASSYPRVSWATAGGVGEMHVQASRLASKTVDLKWLDMRLPASEDGHFELGDRLREALAGGGCAAVICNTVRRAQEVYQALKPHFPGRAEDGPLELDLLHSRYPFEERDRREQRARLRFGKLGGDAERPSRAVLVATQIIEQSLDLDFDFMVTELAPVDLVLQRAGRLHRHARERPLRLRSPALLLSAVEEDTEGVPRFEPGTQSVYDAHVLLRSWLALRDGSTIRVPDDVEALIEEVYGERTCPHGLRSELRKFWEETLEKQRRVIEADEHEAWDRWLRPPWSDEPLWQFTDNSLEEDAPEFHQAHQALTRLADPSVDVVLLHGTPERPCLDRELTKVVRLTEVPAVPQAKCLLQRSVPVSDRRVVFTLLEQPVPSGWCRSPLLRHHRPLVLDAGGGASVGRRRLEVDDELGLLVKEEGGS